MKQTRAMSLVEATANVLAGLVLAVLTQLIVFPWFGVHLSAKDNTAIGVIFTIVSIARSFTLRRLFEGLRARTSRT